MFEQAIRQAQARGLLALPGLLAYHLVNGVRGSRRDLYVAIWTYESKEAWERLWGPVDRPYGKDKYPATCEVL
ncbi:MAG: hypothetical protein ACE5LB_13925 [Acidiferrobacterales bacterium]